MFPPLKLLFLLFLLDLSQSIYIYYLNALTFSILTDTLTCSIVPPQTQNYTQCGSASIFGGFETFGSSQMISSIFPSVPSHANIKISLNVYLLDNWAPTDMVSLIINGKTTNIMDSDPTSRTQNLCGNSSFKDRIFTTSLVQPDSSSTLNITMNTSILSAGPSDQGKTESWGIRDLYVYLDVPCQPLCINCDSGTCSSFTQFANEISPGEIQCKNGFFVDITNNKCTLCDYTCQTCVGQGNNNCTSCFGDDILSSSPGSCSHSNALFISFAEFTGGDSIPVSQIDGTWTISNISANIIDNSCFYPMFIVGGYKIMDATSSFTKYYSPIIVPHYKISIRFQAFSIGLMNGYLSLYIDDYPIPCYSYNFSSADASDYLSNQNCFSLPLFHHQVYYEGSHFNSSLKIQVKSLAMGIFYWGFNDFVVTIFECYPTCTNCTGPNSNQCTACYPNSVLSITNECACTPTYSLMVPLPIQQAIPCGSYPCSYCFIPIYQCNGYFTNGQCYSCTNGNFVTNNYWSCDPCDANCLTCVGASTNCLSCRNGTLLQGATCVAQCSNGFYGNTTDYVCHSCDSMCRTCDIASTNCTSCSDVSFSYGSTCVTQCPNGFYGSNNSVCIQCSAPCFTCSGLPGICLSCQNGFYLEVNTCVTQCSNGLYGSIEGMCDRCDANCLTCQNSSSFCTSCLPGTYVYDNSCLAQCPNQFYASIIDQSCKNCDASCLLCSENSTNCLSCQSGLFLDGSLCVSECPSGKYSTTTSCALCDSICLTCLNSPLNCTSCPNGTYLYDSQCRFTCPPATYLSYNDNSCQSCDPSCATCEISPNNCTSCNNQTYLENSLCVDECSSGLYLSNLDNSCKECDGSCLNCVLVSTYCTSCTEKLFLEGTKCISSCPIGTYSNYTDMTCKPCDISCEICEGMSTNCTIKACSNAQYFDDNTNSCSDLFYIGVSLFRNYSNLSTFQLILNNSMAALIERIVNNQPHTFSLSISNLSTSDYSYNMDASTNVSLRINFIFQKIVDENNVLSIDFNLRYINIGLKEAIFVTDNVSIDLSSIIVYINPTLTTTNDPQTLTLGFSDSFPLLFDNFPSFSTVQISDFRPGNYVFNIMETSNPLNFNFFLNYSISIIGDHSLELTFNISGEELQKQRLTSKHLKIQLPNYYILTEEEKTAIEQTKTSTQISTQSATSVTSCFSLLNSGSSLAFSALLLLKFIKVLKLLNINYPPNALEIFENNFIIFNFDFFPLPFDLIIAHDDNPADLKFAYYNVDNYFLNNMGANLYESLVIALIVFILDHVGEKLMELGCLKSTLFLSLFKKVYHALCWNFFYTFLIGSINDFFFYAIINLAFLPNFNSVGILNIVISVLVIAFNVAFLLSLYRKITKLNYMIMYSRLEISVFGKRHTTSGSFRKSIKKNRIAAESAATKLERSNLEDNSFVCAHNFNRNISIAEMLKGHNLRPLGVKRTQISPFFGETKISPVNSFNHVNEAPTTTRIKLNRSQILNDNDLSLSSPSGYDNMKASNAPLEEKLEDENTTNTNKFLKKYKVLFEDFKQESKLTSVYFLLDLIKYPVITLIVVLDRYQPLRQSCFILSIIFGMLLFLAYVRPLKSKVIFMQYLLNQVCLLLCTASSLVLAYYDKEKDYEVKKRLLVGWIIVYGNLGMVYCITGIMISYSLIIVWNNIKMIYRFLLNKINPRKEHN